MQKRRRISLRNSQRPLGETILVWFRICCLLSCFRTQSAPRPSCLVDAVGFQLVVLEECGHRKNLLGFVFELSNSLDHPGTPTSYCRPDVFQDTLLGHTLKLYVAPFGKKWEVVIDLCLD